MLLFSSLASSSVFISSFSYSVRAETKAKVLAVIRFAYLIKSRQALPLKRANIFK
jgi:hypothetical protein